jgi:hypothetical protein
MVETMRSLVNSILLVALVWGGLAGAAPKATFQDSYLRYLSGHDLARVFKQKFPGLTWDSMGRCATLTPDIVAALGTANPVNGELVYPAPSVPFLKWYVGCVMTLAEADLQSVKEAPEGYTRFIGPKAIALAQGQSYSTVIKDPKSVSWTTLPETMRFEIVNHLLENFIGAGIVNDSTGVAKKMNDAVSANNFTTYDALAKLILLIATQDEFLTY